MAGLTYFVHCLSSIYSSNNFLYTCHIATWVNSVKRKKNLFLILQTAVLPSLINFSIDRIYSLYVFYVVVFYKLALQHG